MAADKTYWEVRRYGVPLAGGPKSTMPDAEQRKSMREGGCKIYVEGKIFKEAKCNTGNLTRK